MSKLNSALVKVQAELKAPKGQRNNFGKYNYRSAEDILEAVKPLLLANGLTMTITDSILEILNIPFVESTCVIYCGEDSVTTKAQAGIDPNRKGMDIAQCFGASSSYSRKYALNGMFLIDDTKDADATNTHGASHGASQGRATAKASSSSSVDSDWFTKSIDYIKKASNKKQAFEMISSKYGESASPKQIEALKKFIG
jgi:hypothetical protein